MRVASGFEAFKRIESHPPALAIVRKELPDRSGFELIADVREEGSDPNLPVVLYATDASPRDLLQHRRSAIHADAYFMVPFPAMTFAHTIRKLVESKE